MPSCDETIDDETTDIIAIQNFSSQSGFSDYECSIPSYDDDLNMPGITINGSCDISDSEITQTFNYEITEEWFCAMWKGYYQKIVVPAHLMALL